MLHRSRGQTPDFELVDGKNAKFIMEKNSSADTKPDILWFYQILNFYQILKFYQILVFYQILMFYLQSSLGTSFFARLVSFPVFTRLITPHAPSKRG
jgi:hypothetical protein